MKQLTKAKDIKKATELAKIIEMRRFLDKKEAELKSYFKDLMGLTDVILIGNDWIIMLDTQTRTLLDKEKLQKDLGEKIHAYETIQNVRILRIKSAQGGV